MALITLERGEYIRLIKEKCFINSTGLYVATIVYRTPLDREKEKEREPLQREFKNSVNLYIQSKMDLLFTTFSINYNSIPEEVPEAAMPIILEIDQLISFKEDDFNIYFYGGWNYNNQSIIINKSLDLIIDHPAYQKMKEFGFQDIWLTDPVVILREEIVNIDLYRKQNFDLTTFYSTLKNNWISAGGFIEDI